MATDNPSIQLSNFIIFFKGAMTHPCSPFIVLYLLPNKQEVFESRVINRDLNPYFNQIFDFPSLLPEDIRKQTLVMKVFHSRRTKHELIGKRRFFCFLPIFSITMEITLFHQTIFIYITMETNLFRS